MSDYPSYSVLDSYSPASVEQTEESVFVKGFASLESPDRQYHLAPSHEFNVDTFLNTGTLLRDHKFVKDPNGNAVSSGVVREAEPAFVSEEREGKYIVSSSRTFDEINSLEAEKFPDLSVGTRGLFVVAEVTEPLTKKEVLKGELGAFSWRGLVNIVKGESHDTLRMIDLKEISLVHIPQHPGAAFMIGKSEEVETQAVAEVPREIVKFKLSKELYPDEATAKAFLQARGIEYLSITENDTDFFAVVQEQAQFDIAKSYLVTVGNVSVVTASRLEKDSLNAELVGDLKDTPVKDNTVSEQTQVQKSLRVCFVDEEVIDKYFPNCRKEVVKSEEVTDESGEAVMQEEVKVELSEEDMKALADQIKPDAPEAAPEEEVVEEPSAEQEPAEESTLTQLMQMIQELTSKLSEPAPQPEPEAEPAAAEPEASEQSVEDQKKELVEALKSEIAAELRKELSSAAFPLTSREERVEATKGEPQPKDDYALFSSVFFGARK